MEKESTGIISDATPEYCRREPLLPPEAETAKASSWRLNVNEFRLLQQSADDDRDDDHAPSTFRRLLRSTSKPSLLIITHSHCVRFIKKM
jgi:hypothetical protein